MHKKMKQKTKENYSHGSENETTVCFHPSTHSMWQVVGDRVECFSITSQMKVAQHIKVIHPYASNLICRERPGLIQSRKNCQCWCTQLSPSDPLRLISFIFFQFSSLPKVAWRSHDCLPLLLHHRWGFLVLAGPSMSRMLLVRNVKLLSWRG